MKRQPPSKQLRAAARALSKTSERTVRKTARALVKSLRPDERRSLINTR